MRIYFIRHAEAIEADEFGGDDLQRPLTKAGRKKTTVAYRRLARVVNPPDLIVSSDAVRAIQTAEILKARFPKAKLTKSTHFNPGRGLSGFRLFMKSLRRKDMTMAIVGHEPDLSRIISQVVASGRLDLQLKKGACAEVDVNISGRGTLRSLLSLNAMAGNR